LGVPGDLELEGIDGGLLVGGVGESHSSDSQECNEELHGVQVKVKMPHACIPEQHAHSGIPAFLVVTLS
jgi:hypothetical protein